MTRIDFCQAPFVRWPWFPFLAGLLLVAGCSGPDIGHVSGKVTVGGQPLTEGSVVFEDAAAGISVNAPLESDGTYTVKTFDRDGLPPGSYRVAITPSTFGDGETPLVTDGADQAAGPVSTIPERYRSPGTSRLIAEVKPGDNPPFNFDLLP